MYTQQNPVSGRETFQKFKPFIKLFIKCFSLFPKKIRIKLFEHFRMTKGIKGLAIRYILFKSVAKSCGDNVAIYSNVYIFKPDKLSVGNNVSIHEMCYIDATGEIEIGDDVSIAHGVTILSTTHTYNENKIPVKYQKVIAKKTTIGNDVLWIGAKATILCGINIGDGSIIGANSVVTKSVEPNTICAGIPTRVTKKRGDKI